MKIDRTEAARIAELARLEFDDVSLERIANDLSRILDYVDQLEKVDVSNRELPTDVDTTPLRDDDVRASLRRAEIERNAPRFAHGFFVVPRVIGEE